MQDERFPRYKSSEGGPPTVLLLSDTFENGFWRLGQDSQGETAGTTLSRTVPLVRSRPRRN